MDLKGAGWRVLIDVVIYTPSDSVAVETIPVHKGN